MIQASSSLPVRSHLQPFFKNISKGISLFVIGIGCLVLVGWALDIAALKSILPGFANMKSNTALLLVFGGISLRMLVDGQNVHIARVCALLIALIGLVTLGEYLFNINAGIDQLFFSDTTQGILHPGRMSPSTALVFLLLGLAMIFLDRSSVNRFVEPLVIIAFAISALALIGYLYGVSVLYQIGAYTSMALSTALSLLLLSLGVLFSRPQRGMMQMILADTLGGDVLRRFLPVAVFLPIILGWIRLWGQRAGLYDTPLGLALMVVSLITTMMISILLNARQLTDIDIKRIQLDESLRASDLRFRSTLESMMEGCQIIGYDWRYLFLNDAAVEQSQLARNELLGHTMMECYPGIEETALFTTLKESMKQRTSHHMVNEFIYSNGTKGWFELSIQPAADGIFILSTDITRHKQSEAALLEREMKLTTLFDILPVGISILDVDRKVSYTNTALKRILDISAEGLLEGVYRNRKYLHSDGTLMPADELASEQAFREKKEIDAVETGVLKEDGSIVWTEVSAVPVDFPDWKMVVVTSDITERKQAEEDLRTNESRLSLAASAGGVGIWDWDVVKDELIWDDSMYSLYNIRRKDFIGAYNAWISALHPDDRQFIDGEIQAALRGEREYAPEFRVMRPDGAVRIVKATSQTIRDQDGKALRMIGTNIDITERKQIEEEILKLNEGLETRIAERTAELAAANELLNQLALFDQLTGLYNRHGFRMLAEEQLALARRAKWNLVVFYGDLDRLKQINDQQGHATGDEAIVMAAQALTATFRSSDIKARLGGDEFIVLAFETQEQMAQILLTRLHGKLAENGQSMSVGVVSFDMQNEISIDDLIARADEAMYAEKRIRSGRGSL